MAGLDQRLVSALEAQLMSREEALRRGAAHIGWKLGMGDRESIGGRIAVGFLTSATVLGENRYSAPAHADLHVDAEAMIELRADVDAAAGAAGVADAIGGFGAAVEVVDLAPVDGEPDAVVADNVFHRAVAFAPTMLMPAPTLQVRISVDGEVRAAGVVAGRLGGPPRGGL